MTKQECNSLLGIVNYLSQFILTMTDLANILRKFLKRHGLFNGQIAIRQTSINQKTSVVMHAFMTSTFLNQGYFK